MIKFLQLDLKEDIIIIEIPRALDYEFINKDSKYLKVGDEEVKLDIPTLSKLELICKGSELTEDITKGLVENVLTSAITFKNYNGKIDFAYAINSFISAIEAKGYYWGENPIKHLNDIPIQPDSLSWWVEQESAFIKAESKTFNLDNTYIFKHN